MYGRDWTAGEILLLRKMRASGKTLKEIAQAINRSFASVQMKAQRLGCKSTIKAGGRRPGYVYSAETRRKMSEAAKAQKNRPVPVNGKPHTEEAKAKMRRTKAAKVANGFINKYGFLVPPHRIEEYRRSRNKARWVNARKVSIDMGLKRVTMEEKVRNL